MATPIRTVLRIPAEQLQPIVLQHTLEPQIALLLKTQRRLQLQRLHLKRCTTALLPIQGHRQMGRGRDHNPAANAVISQVALGR